ncbi:MAG: transposase [Deltaproteobacteria bacterium]|nr:transposase [Deltaproteobacteria bacterium]
MVYDPTRHHRCSIRLQGYNYVQAGAYFVTICVQGRACLFGDVVNGEMRLSIMGCIVYKCWQEILVHFSNVVLDAVVIMPNHVHGIIVIDNDGVAYAVGATHASPLRGPRPRSIGAIVGSFKSAAAKRINKHRSTLGAPVWQRHYYEHIIRSDESLYRIREYIVNNPMRWEFDRENPVRATHASPLQKDEPWRI